MNPNQLKKKADRIMKFLSILSIAFLTFISCNKSSNNGCTSVQPKEESASIATFCTANHINYTVDTNGIYYQIIDPGSGARPTDNSTITVIYSTTLLSGQLVDTSAQTTAVSFPLYQVIEGWRIAIPYIQKGGHIKFVLPSTYAYGCTGNRSVPPNSPLYFDVTLKDVQ